jgi:hypothetical protein
MRLTIKQKATLLLLIRHRISCFHVNFQQLIANTSCSDRKQSLKNAILSTDFEEAAKGYMALMFL